MTETSQWRSMATSFWIWLGAITLTRIALLMVANTELGPDEAQYWFWSRSLEAGYFSKPPMVAWLIAATTSLFGNAEWAVRLSAPLLHAGTASFIFLTAKQFFDQRTATISGLIWLLLPGVAISSSLVTTDAALLLFWSAGMFALSRIITSENASLTGFVGLGVAIGLGMLSKYAMLYFIAGLALAFALSRDVRAKLITPALFGTVLLAGLIFTPNLLWNAANDFQTVAHTASNANWKESLFRPVSLLTFLASQIAVFGPVFAACLVLFALRFRLKAATPATTMLLALALAPLLIVSGQAFISRANANWAAAAYPAATILTAHFLLAGNRLHWLRTGVIINGLCAAIVAISLTNILLPARLGAGSAVSELSGWRGLTEQIAAQARNTPYDVILFDDRSMIAEMLYYQRNTDIEIAALDPNNGVHHHFEAFLPFRPEEHQRALYVSILPTDEHVSYRFSNIERLGDVEVTTTAGEVRRFTLFDISGYFGPPDIQYKDAPSGAG